MQQLSDDELAAYAQWAEAERDAPLAALVAELQHRRALAARQVIVVLAPEGTRLPRLQITSASCTLEAYDPAAMHELRQLLAKHGITV